MLTFYLIYLQNMKEQISKLERDLPLLKKKQDEKISLQKRAAQEMLQKQKLEKEKEDKLRLVFYLNIGR